MSEITPKEIQEIACDVIELTTALDKVASENESLRAQLDAAPATPGLDPARVAATLDKCASAKLISSKDKNQIAALFAQDPNVLLTLMEKAAARLDDRVSPMGSVEDGAVTEKTDPLYAEFSGQ